MNTFAGTAIGLILCCFLGVTGVADSVAVAPQGMVVYTSAYPSWQIGGFVFLGGYTDEHTQPHEFGHWEQEKLMGTAVYLAVVGAASVKNYLRYMRGRLSLSGYVRTFWERDADIRGGVER